MTSVSEAVEVSEDPARVLPLADDALVMAQRLLGWIARAPEIEEDVALANIALDLLGRARLLYAHAGARSDPPRTEDELAYLRDADDFRNAVLVERPRGDFAVTMVRLLCFAAHQHELYDGLRSSPDPTLAAIAAKALPEIRYHRDHARLWVLRLGDGTPESHRRAAAALAEEWPWALQLFADLGGRDAAARAWVCEVLDAATLGVPEASAATAPDGRSGRHTADLAPLLAEMQEIARAHPGAVW